MSIRGKKVRLITIEKNTPVFNEYNEQVDNWSPAAALTETNSNGGIYAAQYHKGGDEALKNGQIVAWQKVIWKIPEIDVLNVKDYRIKCDTKIYEIENIWPEGRSNLMIKTRQRDNQ